MFAPREHSHFPHGKANTTMNASFQDLKTLAAERWPGAFVAEGDDVFALATDGLAIRFAALSGDPAATLVRARILDLADVPRTADFAKAALAGNFFWGTPSSSLPSSPSAPPYDAAARVVKRLRS